jgi:single-strand DNA-binding protein
MQENGQSQGGINNAVVVGRAGQDPEIKYFESGSVKASFSVAVNRPSKEKETDWFNIEAWGRTAEIVGEYLKKGREVAVSGRLNVRKYTDQAGNERDFLSVVASDVKFLGSRRDNEGGGYGNEQTGNRAPF